MDFCAGTIYDGLAAEHLDTNPQFGDFFNSAWDVNFRLTFGRPFFGGRICVHDRTMACHKRPRFRLPSRSGVEFGDGVPSRVSVS
ncbi:MAG: hypothetical protein R3C28_10750 [Pirellulaceae bacterium]